jgi:hypothetical protein
MAADIAFADEALNPAHLDSDFTIAAHRGHITTSLSDLPATGRNKQVQGDFLSAFSISA